jgi:1,4-dihydroxy-2-naphthoate polyprenyltransferase
VTARSLTDGPPTGAGVWVSAARPKTLLAAVAPVILGTAIAVVDGGFHLGAAVCALLGAMLIQVGTNYSNDYHDFVKGADTDQRKGPTRATQAGLVSPQAMRSAAAIAFALAFAAGVYLIYRGGWPILAIGVASILSGIWYTAGRYSLAYLGLADLFVLVFFGPIAVVGTYYVQALNWSFEAMVAGLGPGILAVAILLVNNIRDVDEDRLAGKRTLIVRLGRSIGVGLYGLCLVIAALVPVALVVHYAAPVGILAASVVPVFGSRIIQHLRSIDDPRSLNPLLGMTSMILFAYCLVLSGAWLLA